MNLKTKLVILCSVTLLSCTTAVYQYGKNWQINDSLPQNINLQQATSINNSHLAATINGLKNTTYGIFFKQGIFAGRDGVGVAGYKYQRWQVPLVMGTLIDVNRDYMGAFHDFLPTIAASQSKQYGSYGQFQTMLYRINNWDTLPKEQQVASCKLTYHCFLIDDRLWWTNFFISYAEGLKSSNPNDPNAERYFNYAYRIFVEGISHERYVNTHGTNDAHSVMWYSDAKQNIYYKSTISNSLYVTAGARLAKYILLTYGKNNAFYDYQLVLKQTRKVADGYFLKYSARVKNNGLLLDGVGTGFNNPPLGRDLALGQTANEMFTYNQGVILPGMAVLTELTGKNKYLNYAKELVRASYSYSINYNGFFDDYGYLNPNGWYADSDGLAFRLAYWQYLALFLDNYNLASDPDFTKLISGFINNNAKQLIVRMVVMPGYTTAQTPTLAVPNHGNIQSLAVGSLFSYYPDGYSLPGIAAALEVFLLQVRLNYALTSSVQ